MFFSSLSHLEVNQFFLFSDTISALSFPLTRLLRLNILSSFFLLVHLSTVLLFSLSHFSKSPTSLFPFKWCNFLFLYFHSGLIFPELFLSSCFTHVFPFSPKSPYSSLHSRIQFSLPFLFIQCCFLRGILITISRVSVPPLLALLSSYFASVTSLSVIFCSHYVTSKSPLPSL